MSTSSLFPECPINASIDLLVVGDHGSSAAKKKKDEKAKQKADSEMPTEAKPDFHRWAQFQFRRLDQLVCEPLVEGVEREDVVPFKSRVTRYSIFQVVVTVVVMLAFLLYMIRETWYK